LQITIGSILNQTLKYIEIIIVDDGNNSKDRKRIEQIATIDNRIKLLTNSHNIGLTKSLIFGCNMAAGKFIARIDNGDIMVPSTRLYQQKKILEKNSNFAIVGGGIEIVDTLNALRYRSKCILEEHEKILKKPKHKSLFMHVTVMMRTDCYQKSGGYNSNLKVGQDTDLWHRIIMTGKGCNLPEIFAIAPMRSNSISVKRNNDQIKGRLRKHLDHFRQKEITFFEYQKLSALEIMKLILPVRFRIMFRYLRNMKFVGRIPKKYLNSTEKIAFFYRHVIDINPKNCTKEIESKQ
jgi:glycosyltransferase involved in cell wall biosynthesis